MYWLATLGGVVHTQKWNTKILSIFIPAPKCSQKLETREIIDLGKSKLDHLNYITGTYIIKINELISVIKNITEWSQHRQRLNRQGGSIWGNWWVSKTFLITRVPIIDSFQNVPYNSSFLL